MTAPSGSLSAEEVVAVSLTDSAQKALAAKFPPRPVPMHWQATVQSADGTIAVLERVMASEKPRTWDQRRLGVQRILGWLERFEGVTWQERWRASGSDSLGWEWAGHVAGVLTVEGRSVRAVRHQVMSGVLCLLCGDVIRPSLEWLVTRNSAFLRQVVAERRDPQGYAALRKAAGEMAQAAIFQRTQTQVALLVLAKGGGVRDITVGDCLQLHEVEMRVLRAHTARSLYYSLLKEMGVFPADAPATLRALTLRAGQASTEDLVDRYRVRCRLVRDLFVDYLNERRPSLDFNSFEDLSRTLVRCFWTDLEQHHPGIDSLRLAPEVAAAWKERVLVTIRRRRQPDGSMREIAVPRTNPSAVMGAVRAFYLDLAQWAAQEPARWGPWVAPCPVKDSELVFHKHNKQVKARADQRTRERLPALPAVVAAAERHLKDAHMRLEAFRSAPLGAAFTVLGETFTKPRSARSRSGPTYATDTTGRRRYLVADENRAFWVWASVEFLRHTGARIEEMLEVSHHSIVQYTLPTTGEVVPLLQIAPSKTDEERMLLVMPELADVLSAVVSRVRDATGRIPLVACYDIGERVWNPPLPLLFQWRIAGQNRPVTGAIIRRGLTDLLLGSGLTDASGQPLLYQPHDFRRIFVTDAILNGLPPHIAQVICGHKDIATTIGYNAVYPREAIEAHRAFIARRRSLRPGEEYRTPTSEEWDAFLGHFEKRKVAIGTCARAFGTPCIHEHACVRCSLLRPEPTQRPRLVEIRDNLLARIAEAEREGWLGEIEGLKVSLAGARDKLAQLDAEQARARRAIHLGMPTFPHIAGRDGTSPLRLG
ncbi:tyrosine-type recombinase/integrase [Streptomyces albus]|uniref:tyrosine-type recombinase/integrase n=1 Tax=Streptomyces albus TaxID=1888 RepID=UPI0033F327BB